MWWEKPQSVNSITELPLSAELSPFSLPHWPGRRSRIRGIRVLVLFARQGDYPVEIENKPMPNNSLSDEIHYYFAVCMLLGAMFLGGVQCTA